MKQKQIAEPHFSPSVNLNNSMHCDPTQSFSFNHWQITIMCLWQCFVLHCTAAVDWQELHKDNTFTLNSEILQGTQKGKLVSFNVTCASLREVANDHNMTTCFTSNLQ